MVFNRLMDQTLLIREDGLGINQAKPPYNKGLWIHFSLVSLPRMEGRIIGRYKGEGPGPLLICIGGMHGNESAGILAIKEVLRLLDIEKDFNPGFHYKGSFVGILGNLPAIQRGQRFIDRDLNRMLLPEELERITSTSEELWTAEDRECIELIRTIEEEKKEFLPSASLILDLHTTTADGGIFTIAADDKMSRTLAKGLHAPVIQGFEEKLKGTTLGFFNRPAKDSYCIVFEAGQHNDPESVYRTAAAIVNCMRTIGSVDSRDVDHRHDGMLIKMSEGLPKVTRLIYHYRIAPQEQFVMNPGYSNFQQLTAGEIVAQNEHGPVTSPVGGLILMPKYQALGDDGFFVVEVVE
jgi:succinylglutamate desuccinylase